MIPNHHFHERLAQVHRQDLLREAEHERLLSQLPRSRHILLFLLHALRIRLQKLLRRHIV